MSAETEALQAAAAQLLAFLDETKKSNIHIIHGEDVGAVNNITLVPTPAVEEWSDDLVVITHVANPTTSTAPRLKVSALPSIPITLPNGEPLIAGDAEDIAVFKVEGTGAPTGPRARLLFLGPAAMVRRAAVIVSGVGVEIDATNHANLDIHALEADTLQVNDEIPFFRPGAAGGTKRGSFQQVATTSGVGVEIKPNRTANLDYSSLPDSAALFSDEVAFFRDGAVTSHRKLLIGALRDMFLQDFVFTIISTAVGVSPAGAGFELGEVYPATELANVSYHGTNSYFQGGGGLNSNVATGRSAGSPTPLAAVNSTISGNYRLTHWLGLTGGGGAYGTEWLNWLLFFVKEPS